MPDRARIAELLQGVASPRAGDSYYTPPSASPIQANLDFLKSLAPASGGQVLGYTIDQNLDRATRARAALEATRQAMAVGASDAIRTPGIYETAGPEGPRTVPQVLGDIGTAIIEPTGLPSMKRAIQHAYNASQYPTASDEAGQELTGARNEGLSALLNAVLAFGPAAAEGMMKPRAMPRAAMPNVEPSGAPDASALSLARSRVESFGGGPDAEATAIASMQDQIKTATHPAWRQRLQSAIDAVGTRDYVRGEPGHLSPAYEAAWPDIYGGASPGQESLPQRPEPSAPDASGAGVRRDLGPLFHGTNQDIPDAQFRAPDWATGVHFTIGDAVERSSAGFTSGQSGRIYPAVANGEFFDPQNSTHIARLMSELTDASKLPERVRNPAALREQLEAGDWGLANTKSVADAARRAGFDGMIYSEPGTHNGAVVVFPDANGFVPNVRSRFTPASPDGGAATGGQQTVTDAPRWFEQHQQNGAGQEVSLRDIAPMAAMQRENSYVITQSGKIFRIPGTHKTMFRDIKEFNAGLGEGLDSYDSARDYQRFGIAAMHSYGNEVSIQAMPGLTDGQIATIRAVQNSMRRNAGNFRLSDISSASDEAIDDPEVLRRTSTAPARGEGLGEQFQDPRNPPLKGSPRMGAGRTASDMDIGQHPPARPRAVGMRPAVRDPGFVGPDGKLVPGKIYQGDNHSDALESILESGDKDAEAIYDRTMEHAASNDAHRGFVTPDGKFLTREEGLARLSGAVQNVPVDEHANQLGRNQQGQTREQYWNRQRPRNELIAELQNAWGKNASGIGGSGMRRQGSADHIAAVLRGEQPLPDGTFVTNPQNVSRSTILGVWKRARDAAQASRATTVSPEAASASSTEQAAADRLGIPLERYRRISARGNGWKDSLSALIVAALGLDGASHLSTADQQ